MAPEDNVERSSSGPAGAERRPDLRTALLVVVALILAGWAMRAMATVLAPLVASVLIALAVMPVRDRVRERVPPWLGWLGIVAAMALILLVIALFFGGVWLAAQRIVAELPAEPSQIVETLQGTGSGEDGQASLAEGAVAGAAEGAAEGGTGQDGGGQGQAGQEAGAAPGGGGQPGTLDGLVRMLGDRAAGAASGVAVTILNSALAIVAGLVIIFFLTLLILIESEDWRRKVQAIASARAEWQLSESADVIAGKVRAYLVLRTCLGLATAALYALWLWFFGVGLILVWALLTFLMNFIPTIGSLIAGVLPVIYALLTQDWGTAALVGAGILVIEQVMGNYVDPRLEGSNSALSPLVILLSLLFWGWVWGIPGTLLAVPVTVALVVLGSHVPALRPWALLLTDRTTMGGLDEVTRPE